MTQQIGQITVDLDARVAKFNANIEAARAKLDRSAAQMQKSLSALDRSFGLVGRASAGFLGGLSVVALANFTRGALDTIGGLGELAEQMGVNIKTLQTLQLAARETGNSTEELNSAVSRFSKTVGEAADGNAAAIAGFERLGIKILDAGGQLRSTDDLLREFAEAIRNIDDPARRASAGAELMGRGFSKLLPIFSQGAAGLDDFARRAREMGYEVGENLVAASDKAGDAITLLAEVNLRRAQIFIAEQVLPGWKALGEAFASIGNGAPGAAAKLAELTAEVERLVAMRDRLEREAGPNIGPRGIAAGQIADLNRKIGDLNAERGALARRLNPPAEAAAASEGKSNPISKAVLADVEKAQKIIDEFRRRADFTGDPRGLFVANATARLPEGATGTQQAEVALLAGAEYDRTEGLRELTRAIDDKHDADLRAAQEQGAIIQAEQDREQKARDLLTALKDEIGANERLLGALGQGTDAYERMKATVEILNKLKAEGIALDSETAQKALALAETKGVQEAQIRKTEEALRTEQQLWGRLADTIGDRLGDAFVKGADKAEILRAALVDVVRVLLQIGSTRLDLAGGGGKGGGGGLLGGLFDSIGGLFGAGPSNYAFGSTTFASAVGGGVFPALDSGGSFKVGPTAGIDQAFFGAYVSAGERIHVVPEGEGGGRSGPPIVYNIDARGATQDAIKALYREIRRTQESIPGVAVNAVTDARRRGRGGLAESFG